MEQERINRKLALEIALNGEDAAKEHAAPDAISKAKEYLAGLATTDGRVALGGALLVLQNTIARAEADGDSKIVLDGVKKYAELCRLADFSAADASTRSAQSDREILALKYLESTGAIPKGLDLPEAARLTAQFIVDDVLTNRTAAPEASPETEERTENGQNTQTA